MSWAIHSFYISRVYYALGPGWANYSSYPPAVQNLVEKTAINPQMGIILFYFIYFVMLLLDYRMILLFDINAKMNDSQTMWSSMKKKYKRCENTE